jgi:MFS family permease
MTLWTSGVLVAVAILPKSDDEWRRGSERVRIGEFLPRVQNYRDSLVLLSIPSILLVVMISVLRQSGQGIQSSFYVVYLESISLTGTLIGSLLSAFLLVSAFGALTTGPLMRIFNRFWLLIATVALSIIFIAITPLLGTFFLLLVVIIARGAVLGTVQPLMLTIISQAAGARDQGKGVALRATANRFAMTVIPVVMGGVVELVGIEKAFLVIGIVLLVLLLGLAIYVKLTPAFNV